MCIVTNTNKKLILHYYEHENILLKYIMVIFFFKFYIEKDIKIFKTKP